MKKCSYCAEEIQDTATVCRYCGRDLQESPLHVKKAKLREIAVKELGKTQRALIERLDLLNSEFDKMKNADNINRTILGVLRPLTPLRGNQYREENREEWVNAVSEVDTTTKMLRTQLYLTQGMLKALDEDMLSTPDIDEFIDKYSK